MRKVWSWTVRAGLFFFATACLLGIAGFVWELESERNDQAQYPPPGMLVTISDGRRMHVFCEGPVQAARPTVILEAGANGDSTLMRPLQDRIAAFARVCAYDRAGLGWSSPAAGPRDFDARARDLAEALAAARIDGSLVLVGESFGGLVVRRFAALWPNRVMGIVLVDAAEEGIAFGPLSDRFVSESLAEAHAREWQARLGLVRLVMLLSPDNANLSDVPLELRGPFTSRVARPSYWRAAAEEGQAFRLTPPGMRLPGGFGRLDDLPLSVIAHDKPLLGSMNAVEAGWRAGQERLASLSKCGRLQVAKGYGHDIDLAAPGLVAASVDEIGGWSAANAMCGQRTSR